MTETTLLKALTDAGLASRRKMTDAIKAGKVKSTAWLPKTSVSR